MSFEAHVIDVMDKQGGGFRLLTTYGRKRDGTLFAFVKTRVLWYAVRLIIEGSDAVEREAFYTESGADEYIARKREELEG